MYNFSLYDFTFNRHHYIYYFKDRLEKFPKKQFPENLPTVTLYIKFF